MRARHHWLLLLVACEDAPTDADVPAVPPGGSPEDTSHDADDTGGALDDDDRDWTDDQANDEAYDGSSGGSGGDERSDEDCEDEPTVEGDPLATLGACGRLVYGPYAPRDRDEARDILPDFSWAGFEQGGVALPEVATVVTVSPASGDDTDCIQAAIDEVSDRSPDALGYRGAVQLEAGTFQCREPLVIEASGVVLRGAGQGEDGTTIKSTASEQVAVIEVRGRRGPQADGAAVDITDDYVPVGAVSFSVDDTSGFSAGDAVAVVRTPDDAWVRDMGMDEHDWSASTFEIDHERTIVEVDHDSGRVTVDIPLVDSLWEEHGGGELQPLDAGRRTDHVGIEDLRLDSTYDHDEDEDHAWTGVLLEDVEHAWVRRLTVEHVGKHAVSVDGASRFITVEDVAMLDPISPIEGGTRYAFNVDDGAAVLFQRCYSEEGRHSFVTGSRVPGPIVWLDSLAERAHADDGPHQKWATGLLYDNVSANQLRAQNRAGSGSGHGWAGAQVMFWNGEVTEEFVSDAPPGAMNWVVGVEGPEGDGQWVPEEPPGIQESLGEPVLPRSLYLQQLADRLGEDAVIAITTEEQRAGRIWADLSDWARAGAPTPESTP